MREREKERVRERGREIEREREREIERGDKLLRTIGMPASSRVRRLSPSMQDRY